MTDRLSTGWASFTLVIVMTVRTDEAVINNDLKGIFQKSISNSLMMHLKKDYGFPNAICRSLTELFEELTEVYFGNKRGPYQIIFPATHRNAPPGIPTEQLQKKMVNLTLYDQEDIIIASKKGIHALLLHRMKRIANEALEQDALLTQAEIAMILGESTRTIGRAVKELEKQGILIPTRGKWKDIGRGTSHKIPIIELFLKGYDFLAIKRKTHHSSGSIKRYLKEFARVYFMKLEEYGITEMIRFTGHSEKLLKEYLEIIEAYNKPEYEDQLEFLIKMISPKKNLRTIHTLIRTMTPDVDELRRDLQ
jgi:DNA-binding Lrp family transcriptional regulator